MNCPHCGCDLEPAPKKGKPRSVPQNKRYHAMIRSAFSHWPESHRFRPLTVERLRKWLQAKAGHAIVTELDLAPLSKDEAISAMAAAIIAATKLDTCNFPTLVNSKYYIVRSKSIDFDSLPHLPACALFDAVSDVIHAETGLSADEIMPPIRERKPGKVETFSEVPL